MDEKKMTLMAFFFLPATLNRALNFSNIPSIIPLREYEGIMSVAL